MDDHAAQKLEDLMNQIKGIIGRAHNLSWDTREDATLTELILDVRDRNEELRKRLNGYKLRTGAW